MRYNSLVESAEHIDGVVVRILNPHLDERGSLTEVLRLDWKEVFDSGNLGFAQCYYSVTKPGVARDEEKWHVHQFQKDRFVVVKGVAVFALYDARQSSSTYGRLNLFRMPGAEAPELQCTVLVPEGVLHCFLAVGSGPCILLNFPTRLHDPNDEGRLRFCEANVLLEDGTRFTWKMVREFEDQWYANW